MVQIEQLAEGDVRVVPGTATATERETGEMTLTATAYEYGELEVTI